jgi:hypothetical protein
MCDPSIRKHPHTYIEDTETKTAFDTIKENRIKKGSSVNSLSQLKALPIWPLDRDMT